MAIKQEMVKTRCYECLYEAMAGGNNVEGVIRTKTTSNLRGKILADANVKKLSKLSFQVEEIEVEIPLDDFMRIADEYAQEQQSEQPQTLQ